MDKLLAIDIEINQENPHNIRNLSKQFMPLSSHAGKFIGIEYVYNKTLRKKVELRNLDLCKFYGNNII